MPKIILVSPGAGGKDTLANKFKEKGYNVCIPFTTRPIRKNESNAKDYFFITPEDFQDMLAEDEFLVHADFIGWHYGITHKQWANCDVFIMNLTFLSQLDSEDRNRSLVIYLDIPEETRKERLLVRGDVDSVDRRLAADKEDFEDFLDYDIRITDLHYV